MSLDIYLKKSCKCGECTSTVYEGNITHNLGRMASEAGIYDILWRPGDIPVYKAKDIVCTLEEGLEKLKSNPAHYRQFDSENGWGVYDDFIPFVEEYLQACIDNPNARIIASR